MKSLLLSCVMGYEFCTVTTRAPSHEPTTDRAGKTPLFFLRRSASSS